MTITVALPEEDFMAILSPCGTWRYQLARRVAAHVCCEREMVFVCLNPSTADANRDDPTVRKCCGFARRTGHSVVRIVNLFALRSTDPRGLLAARDPVGPDNDAHIARVLCRSAASTVVVAWGSPKTARLRRLIEARALHVGSLLRAPRNVWCLGRARDGHPRHPLMLPYATSLEEWSP